MILPVGITVSRRKVLCDLRKLVDHRSALSFDLSEFHRQGILAALAVVGHIDGKNVFLPSGQFGRIVHAAAINLHGVNAAQSTDQPFLAELTVIQFHKVHHAPQDRCPERIRFALPCSHDQPQGLAVDFLAHLVVQLECGAHAADAVVAQLQAVVVEVQTHPIGGCEKCNGGRILSHDLGTELDARRQRCGVTVLLCEEQSFLLHRQAGVDLAQNRQILTAVAQDTRFNGMLAVRYIISAIAKADLRLVRRIWGIGMISPYISGLYINSLIKAISFTNLILFITLVASLNLLQMLFDYWQSILSVKLNQTLIYNISNDLFQKIFHSRYEQYGNIDCSYYVDQINKDSHLIVQFFLQNAAAIIFQSVTIVVSGVIIFRVDKILCVIVFLLIPFYIASFKLNDKKMYSSRKKRKEAANKYFSCYSEQIGKLRHIKQATLYKEMENRLFLAFDTMLHAELDSTKIDCFFSNINQTIIIIAYVSIIGIGGYKVSIGDLSVGYFTIINTYFNMTISAVSYFVGLAGSYQDAKISFQRVDKIMNQPNENIGSKKVEKIQEVKIESLSISYEKKEVLNLYNYSFHCGRIYGIVGKNGSGKTTVLNAMINIFSGEHMGEIFYNGISLNDLDMPQIRRQKVSYVEQHPTMFNISVQNYLHFGVDYSELVGYNQSILLKMFELEYLLDKEINENGSNLSGGEKQKLSIVRSLSKDSSLILLDEPTSALDQKSITTLIEYLELRKQQAIIVIVSHDSRILSSCDELVEMR